MYEEIQEYIKSSCKCQLIISCSRNTNNDHHHNNNNNNENNNDNNNINKQMITQVIDKK